MEVLNEFGQNGLLDAFKSSEESVVEAAAASIATQIKQLDEENMNGGLKAYVDRARNLLAGFQNGDFRDKGLVPELPRNVCDIRDTSDANVLRSFVELENIGATDGLKDTCFVLQCGSTAATMGYPSPLPLLTPEVTSRLPLLAWWCQYVKRVQEMVRAEGNGGEGGEGGEGEEGGKEGEGGEGGMGGEGGNSGDPSTEAVNGGGPIVIPLVLVTSDETRADIERLLKDRDFFGIQENITFLDQKKVPAFDTVNAGFARQRADPTQLQTHLRGSGDVHELLHSSGLVNTWQEQGRKWICILDTNNPLLLKSTTALIGRSVRDNLCLNILGAPRRLEEKGCSLLCSFEGTDVAAIANPLLAHSESVLAKIKELQEGSPDKHCPLAGYAGAIVVRIDAYNTLFDPSGDALLALDQIQAQFRDSAKEKIREALPVQRFAEDIGRVFGAKSVEPCGVTVMPRWLCLSPVVESIDFGAKAVAECGYALTPSTAEFDFYRCTRKMLGDFGVNVADDAKRSVYQNIEVVDGAKVVILPATAITVAQLKECFPTPSKISLSANSSLLIEGSVRVLDLSLDGAMYIKALNGAEASVQNMGVTNRGWEFLELTVAEMGTALELFRMRGYRVESLRQNTSHHILDTPGAHVIADNLHLSRAVLKQAMQQVQTNLAAAQETFKSLMTDTPESLSASLFPNSSNQWPDTEDIISHWPAPNPEAVEACVFPRMRALLEKDLRDFDTNPLFAPLSTTFAQVDTKFTHTENLVVDAQTLEWADGEKLSVIEARRRKTQGEYLPAVPLHLSRILYVCPTNSFLSQVAEASTKAMSTGSLHIRSAGIHPAPIHPLAGQVMRHLHTAFKGHFTKDVSLFQPGEFDVLVVIGGPALDESWQTAEFKLKEEWPDLTDPGQGETSERPELSRAASEIQGRVLALLRRLTAGEGGGGGIGVGVAVGGTPEVEAAG